MWDSPDFLPRPCGSRRRRLTIGGVYSELDMPLDGQSGRPLLADLENGQPHHVAATYNSATGLKAIFIDGVLRFSSIRSIFKTTDHYQVHGMLGPVAVPEFHRCVL